MFLNTHTHTHTHTHTQQQQPRTLNYLKEWVHFTFTSLYICFRLTAVHSVKYIHSQFLEDLNKVSVRACLVHEHACPSMKLRTAHPVGEVSHLRIVVSDLKIDNNSIKLN